MNREKRKIELLAPAGNLRSGIAAINHGADAVYIGGPAFSARAAASNSLADIEQLVRYSHQFNARVYVALNTLFTDREIEQAVDLTWQMYEIGADALIVQDVGLLESDIPPIPLHSSTQMNNRTPEKVRFLEEVGFSQVVLARELSLDQIRSIRAATTVPLECFIHGALCVSYSGQCYISESVAGRSANRGNCAQFCRHAYDLCDLQGNTLAQEKYLLSLKDLNLSHYLNALIDAGIDSFKIEGRLKNENYVKNITAYYRQLLDALILERKDLVPSSSGICNFTFVPDPDRVFNRGYCSYFVKGKRNRVAQVETPKSLGKMLGQVNEIQSRSFTLNTKETVVNGDGLCFFNDQHQLVGIRVNRAEGTTIFPWDGVTKAGLRSGLNVYRNLDVEFSRQLQNSILCRRITVALTLQDKGNFLQLQCVDEDAIESVASIPITREKARKPGTLEAVACRQLQKSGETVFSIGTINTELDEDLFVPTAVINALRRKALDLHLERRLEHYQQKKVSLNRNTYPWVAQTVSFFDNITNSRAAAFYLRHGVPPFSWKELRAEFQDKGALMTTRYCVRYQLGMCLRKGPQEISAEPLILADRTGKYLLEFCCRQCEMTIKKLIKLDS
ncbi:peptidase U32 family protein [Desulfogranum japonicum]|uniref:peptidase U32 family protein n=1 Tax=Desulfogranum japonicum TaxID=231447 RepID=UPI0004066509|nr:U32 family peptidase [Desulfogranum japonicum]